MKHKKATSRHQPRWAQPPGYQCITVVETTLVLVSPLSISGDEEIGGDAPVLRDNHERPFLPGTALAGVLRSELEELYHDDLSIKEKEAIKRLFGYVEGEDGRNSMLTFDDAFLTTGQEGFTEFRDFVRLEQKTGVAEEGKKFDREFVCTGTKFDFRMEWRTQEPPQQSNPLDFDLVLIALSRLQEGIGLGARTRRGFGQVKALVGPNAWAWKTFDLRQGKDLVAWIKRESPPRNREKVSQIAAGVGYKLPSIPVKYPLVLSLRLNIQDSLLIRAAAREAPKQEKLSPQQKEPHPADASHLQRPLADGNVELILSATSLAGALRSRARAIATLLAEESGQRKAKTLVEALFGVEDADKQTSEEKQEPHAGGLLIEEAVITGAKELRHTRVVIDPWTGGALEGFLFTEDVLYGGEIEINIKLSRRCWERKDAHSALGLLFFTLRDLWEGDLPVGGEVGGGRGTLLGLSGKLTYNGETTTLDFRKPGHLSGGAENIALWASAMHEYLVPKKEAA